MASIQRPNRRTYSPPKSLFLGTIRPGVPGPQGRPSHPGYSTSRPSACGPPAPSVRRPPEEQQAANKGAVDRLFSRPYAHTRSEQRGPNPSENGSASSVWNPGFGTEPLHRRPIGVSPLCLSGQSGLRVPSASWTQRKTDSMNSFSVPLRGRAGTAAPLARRVAPP